MERFNFFKNIENRYKSKISVKKPLVIRFDGKGITKNPFINLLDEKEGSFSDALKKTAKFISGKYRCISFISGDELNLVFENPLTLISYIKSVDIQKINSLLTQELFYIFNKYINAVKPIYFDCRCFNIPKDKIDSYLLYRVNSASNTAIQYFAKKNIDKELRHGKHLDFIINYLENNIPSYAERTVYQREGFIYIKGNKIIPSKYFKKQLIV